MQNNKKGSAGDVAGYLIMLVYALAMLGLGWYGMRKAKSQSDFLVAGRRLDPGLYLGNHGRGGARRRVDHRYGQAQATSSACPACGWYFMLGLGIIVLSLDGVLAADRAPADVHRDPGAGAALPGLLAP